jgi:hypothetical protein
VQTNLNAQCVLPSKTLARFLKTAVTPLFLYDEKSLVQAAQALFRAFSDCNGFLPRFPIRMNPNPTVLQILRGCGCGVNLTYSAMHGINIRRSRFKPQYSPFQKFTFRKFAPCHKVGKGLEFIFIGNNYADFFIF